MLFFDFETYFAQKYDLKTLSIDEYVEGDMFKVHGVSYAYNDEKPKYVWGDDLDIFIKSADWSEVACHNAYFDVFVLTSHYGIVPGFIYDTMCMARAIYGPDVSASLENVAQRMELGGKVPGLEISKGKHTLSEREQKILGDYAIYDVMLLRDIYKRLRENFPISELELIDITIRMFTEPKVKINAEILKERLAEILKGKDDIISGLKDVVKGEFAFDPLNQWRQEIVDILQSDDRFAKELSRFTSVPMKTSPRTGEKIPALAKTDLKFIKLKDHKKDEVRKLVEARLAVSSNLEENRIQRFLNYDKLPIYLNYYGAHTGRWSGGNKMNIQNLTRGSVLRESIEAPDDYMIVVSDQSQIEARLTAWLAWVVTGRKADAGVKKMLDVFREGGDVYAQFASELYGYKVTKSTHPTERFIGKVAILGLGYGMGSKKFHKQLGQAGVNYTLQEATDVVKFYRETYHEIPRLWRGLETTLRYILEDKEAKITDFLHVDSVGIRLPNGLHIRYNALKKDDGGYTYEGYKERRRRRINVYGGLVTENIIQALARITIGNNILSMNKKFPKVPHRLSYSTPIIAMVHDEVLVLAKEEDAENIFNQMIKIMSTPPRWAPDLPVAAEGGWAKNYSK